MRYVYRYLVEANLWFSERRAGAECEVESEGGAKGDHGRTSKRAHLRTRYAQLTCAYESGTHAAHVCGEFDRLCQGGYSGAYAKRWFQKGGLELPYPTA